MLEQAMKALRLVQNETLAKTVTYRHGTESVEIRAVPGQTLFRAENEYGQWVRTQRRDFIIEDGQFTFFPEKGDVIEFAGREFEVLAPNDEPVECAEEPVAVFRNRFGGKVRSAKRGERRNEVKPPARARAVERSDRIGGAA